MPEENNYPAPKGYEPINQTEHHSRHMGDGFHRRDEDGNLIMAFWIKKETIVQKLYHLLIQNILAISLWICVEYYDSLF